MKRLNHDVGCLPATQVTGTTNCHSRSLQHNNGPVTHEGHPKGLHGGHQEYQQQIHVSDPCWVPKPWMGEVHLGGKTGLHHGPPVELLPVAPCNSTAVLH